MPRKVVVRLRFTAIKDFGFLIYKMVVLHDMQIKLLRIFHEIVKLLRSTCHFKCEHD